MVIGEVLIKKLLKFGECCIQFLARLESFVHDVGSGTVSKPVLMS